jgi:hypothetical protein
MNVTVYMCLRAVGAMYKSRLTNRSYSSLGLKRFICQWYERDSRKIEPAKARDINQRVGWAGLGRQASFACVSDPSAKRKTPSTYATGAWRFGTMAIGKTDKNRRHWWERGAFRSRGDARGARRRTCDPHDRSAACGAAAVRPPIN